MAELTPEDMVPGTVIKDKITEKKWIVVGPHPKGGGWVVYPFTGPSMQYGRVIHISLWEKVPPRPEVGKQYLNLAKNSHIIFTPKFVDDDYAYGLFHFQGSDGGGYPGGVPAKRWDEYEEV